LVCRGGVVAREHVEQRYMTDGIDRPGHE
jgi:hypothetical protein